MASIVSGLLYVATSAQSEQGTSAFLSAVASNSWGGIPIVFLVFVLFLVAVWLILTRTRYGHYVYSVGGNAEASHLSGVPVQRVQMFAFIVGGLFAAAGGLVLLGQTRSEEHTSELQSHVNLVCRLLLEKKKKYLIRILLKKNKKYERL